MEYSCKQNLISQKENYYATLDNTQALNLRRTLDLQMFYMGTGTAVIRNLTKTILS